MTELIMKNGHVDCLSGMWGASTPMQQWLQDNSMTTLFFGGVKIDQCVFGTLTDFIRTRNFIELPRSEINAERTPLPTLGFSEETDLALFQFTDLDGLTRWAKPLGTNSEASQTTFIIEAHLKTTEWVTFDNDVLPKQVTLTATITRSETAVVSASGWRKPELNDDSPISDLFKDCHLTSSTDGECVLVSVIDESGQFSTASTIVTGSVRTMFVPIVTSIPTSSDSQTSTATASQASSNTERNEFTGRTVAAIVGGTAAGLIVIFCMLSKIDDTKKIFQISPLILDNIGVAQKSSEHALVHSRHN
ncbi:hypothetical protein C8R42DRAFT_640105 [Lentinula raphanica]|nr:hypothetical protein C8R42DRAFT_640105 [Lentinula raphanica]